MKTEKPDWKKIARRAVQERDPDKLLAIIEELNAVLEAGANERRARLYAPPGHRIGKRLLFVDDEPNICLTLPPVFEQHGFQVQVAATLSEALAAIRSHNAEGDGFTVIYTAHEVNPACVTILLTGYPAFETALQAIHTEVDDYFVKPWTSGRCSAPSSGSCSLVHHWNRFGNLTMTEPRCNSTQMLEFPRQADLA